jgi:hypothetical protein
MNAKAPSMAKVHPEGSPIEWPEPPTSPVLAPPQVHVRHGFVVLCLAWLAVLLAACAPMQAPREEAGQFRPSPPIPGLDPIVPLPSVPAARRPTRPADLSFARTTEAPTRLWLFHSSTSQAALMKIGIDPTSGTRMWERHFRTTRTPFKRITTAAEIGQLAPDGVLILPSAIALTDAEKDAIRQWRNRGGAVLSTWMTGTHSAAGEPQGYGFMREVLDVDVVGNTKDEPDDTFMIMHGDSPAAHTLAAGTRVWLERIPEQLPLRVRGKQYAGQITTWSREYVAARHSGLIAYGERQMPSGRWSRTATIGFAEQNWLRSDPRQLRAITGDLLGWLQRRPSAYLAAWPHPFGSGLLFALQTAELLADSDVAIAEMFSQFGGRMTCYLLSDDAVKNAPLARKIQALGHELAYFGDKFEAFGKQSRDQQGRRLDAMRQAFTAAGMPIVPGSFATPLDGYDKITLELLQALGFDNYLAFSEVSNAQLPFFVGREARPTVVLPRTLGGPEELSLDDADAGLDNFLAALELSTRMGALSVVRLPSGSLLTPENRKKLLEGIRELRTRAWIASAGQIAQWWRDRAQVSVNLEREGSAHVLTARVAAPLATRQPVTVWVDLPHPSSRLRIRRLEGRGTMPTLAPAEGGRVALSWAQPGPGTHRWQLDFEEGGR